MNQILIAPRRGLRRNDAAMFLGFSVSKFDELVEEGRIPKGFMVDGCRLWDIKELDIAFDLLKAAGDAPRASTRKTKAAFESL